MRFVDVTNDIAFWKILKKKGLLEANTNIIREELVAYDNAFIAERDEIARMEGAKEKGKEEQKIEDVLGLYENEVPIPIIAKSLKLTVEQVNEIIKKHIHKA